MAGAASVWWSDVRSALDRCAAGWTATLKTHHRWIRYTNHTFLFPKGPGADAENYQVHAFQVQKMVQQLGIDLDCMRKLMPALRPSKKKNP